MRGGLSWGAREALPPSGRNAAGVRPQKLGARMDTGSAPPRGPWRRVTGSCQGLIHQVAHELAIAQADEARCSRHKDHAQLLFGINPEVGAVGPRPIIVTGAAGHGRYAALASHGEAQTEAVACRGRIHAV